MGYMGVFVGFWVAAVAGAGRDTPLHVKGPSIIKEERPLGTGNCSCLSCYGNF